MKGCTTAGVYFREPFFISKGQHFLLQKKFCGESEAVASLQGTTACRRDHTATERRILMIKVNGQEEVLAENLTIQDYISRRGYRTNRIAVERNGQIVPKRKYEDTVLETVDQLENGSFEVAG